ncbi:hypothetical protein C791_1032 [Amycolatopsis azurea DSM 43854]|uniref:Uncharacterized protein n=1 Tax=Amycolatopsis azurea DSM 43854 TaxID=1238180 RepID=M2PUR1_9PSEU|nr:hypothetical protein C791_1032 [Amycolatopsis azurea DSM 43854]
MGITNPWARKPITHLSRSASFGLALRMRRPLADLSLYRR